MRAIYQQLNRGTIDRAVAVGQISTSELTAQWAALEQAAEADAFFSAVLGFVVGCKPVATLD